jgi:ATP-binding cassette subfamily C protein LapB
MIGLYPPTSGLVLIDGTDIRQLSPSELRTKIGALLQDNVLLTGSIRENILLGKENVGDEEMLRASKVTLAHEFISRFPSGYDLDLADRGESLSGGQRQSIAMARALVGSPPILVMDEPTSSVDADTEKRLMASLREEFEGRTLLLITHRPSLVRLVDRILMVSNGKLVMDGTPESIRNQVSNIRSAGKGRDGQAA